MPLALDWDDETLPEEVRTVGTFDAIIMADVTYNTSSFPILVRTLDALIRLSSATSGCSVKSSELSRPQKCVTLTSV